MLRPDQMSVDAVKWKVAAPKRPRHSVIRRFRVFVALSLGLMITCCTTFDVPRVLTAGQQSVSVGAAGLLLATGGAFPPIPEVSAMARTHLMRNVDIGARLTWDLFSIAVTGDVKVQILSNPAIVSVNTGGGIGYDFESGSLVPVFRVGAMFGDDELYGAFHTIHNIPPEAPSNTVVMASFGKAFGRKKRFYLEASIGGMRGGIADGLLLALGPGFRILF